MDNFSGNDLIMIGLVSGLVLLVFGSFFNRPMNPPSQQNVPHIEWLGQKPIMVKRVRHDSLEIKPTGIEPGYLTFAGTKGVQNAQRS